LIQFTFGDPNVPRDKVGEDLIQLCGHGGVGGELTPEMKKSKGNV